MSNDIDFEKVLPTNNVMFQIIFGDERHPKILIHFLNSVIKPDSQIKKVHIRKEVKTNQDHISEKGVRLDIVADTDSGEIINVEMQLTDEKNMPERSLYYWSRLFAGQMVVGDEYHGLRRTISINILNFNCFEKDTRYWRKGYLKDEHDGKKFTDRLEMHFIEIKKMKEMKKDSPITFWIEFFKDPYSEQVKSLCEFVPEIKEAKEVFEKAKTSPEAQESMRVLEKSIRDKAASITRAKREEKEEMAKKMLAKNKPIDEIVEFTSLTEAEVKKIGHVLD